MKKKTIQTARKWLALLLMAILLMSLTGCSRDDGTGEENGSKPPLNLNFPEVTAAQAATVRQAEQTEMLPVTSVVAHFENRYIYDAQNRLTRMEAHGSHGLEYYTECKPINGGTSYTVTSYNPDNTLYDMYSKTVTLDADGRCAQVTRTNLNPLNPSVGGDPITYVFAYDAQDRLVRYTDAEGETRYVYDENGDVREETRVNHAAKYCRTYERDGAGQILRTHTKQYDAAGKLVKETNTEYAVEYKNDASGRLAEVNLYDVGTGRLVQKIAYNYDETGKLVGCTKINGSTRPERGLEWMAVDRANWSGELKNTTWLTPEAYRAQTAQ